MTEDTRSIDSWSTPATADPVATDAIPGTAAGLPSPTDVGSGLPDAARSASTGATATDVRSPVGVMDPEAQAASRARLDSTLFPATAEGDAIPSAAAIAGHPLHPMLVPLPIGLLAGAFASDVAYAATRDRLWARASLALTAGGVATGALSAVLGATDFLARARIRRQRLAWFHAAGNALVMAMSAASIAARFRNPERAVVPVGLALSAASGTLLVVTGWLGGELVYRHRIAVVPR